ncbi:DNA double-strand break repair nuclease NurA [Deinococcus cellulosilyticus]|uniref:Nuclease n=1 Tax=Deinococcus cellulosilyticus (strain DSM 18568 / NBRC 106333 / KACC 11606 / 5516J-15) TaxID=1223518 RepID=A0A511N8T4_DEIC1|nr:DNA double-strand break repair nuclease NurA [Deinococcus cellulosilyticus]GEM48947.1 nuclease [Deinococcus cellulosilyticus NBRC 106333 = KACC 11606]
MRLRLDPWSADQPQIQTLEPQTKAFIHFMEGPDWEAIPCTPIPESLEYVYIVDGTRQLYANVTIEDGDRMVFGGLGAVATGAVELHPHGRRPAQLNYLDCQRILVAGGGYQAQPLRLAALAGQCPELIFTPHTEQPNEIHTPLSGLQHLMLTMEQQLSHDLSSDIEEVSVQPIQLKSLVFQDGSLRRDNPEKLVFGIVKTQYTHFLPPTEQRLLSQLKPKERTPIFYLRYEGKSYARYSWYVRLAAMPPYMQSYGGLVRVEAYAPSEHEDLPPAIKLVADFSGELLCRLASESFKDRRAPQNLIPTGALEKELKRRLGAKDIIERRIRQFLMEEFAANQLL